MVFIRLIMKHSAIWKATKHRGDLNERETCIEYITATSVLMNKTDFEEKMSVLAVGHRVYF
jgi:hypothetical protein